MQNDSLVIFVWVSLKVSSNLALWNRFFWHPKLARSGGAVGRSPRIDRATGVHPVTSSIRIPNTRFGNCWESLWISDVCPFQFVFPGYTDVYIYRVNIWYVCMNIHIYIYNICVFIYIYMNIHKIHRCTHPRSSEGQLDKSTCFNCRSPLYKFLPFSSTDSFEVLKEKCLIEHPNTCARHLKNELLLVVLHPGRLTAGTCPHGGLVQIIFLSKWVICRFQPLIFQGVFTHVSWAVFFSRFFHYL